MHSSNYFVAKWLLQTELKRDIIERNAMIEKFFSKRNSKNMFSKIFASRKGQDEVDDYWQDRPDFLSSSERTPQEIAAIMTIQATIRFWKKLAVFKENQKKGGRNMETVLIVQSAIRRFYSKAIAKEIETVQTDQRNAFKQFCMKLKVGIEMLQFSKDLGRPVTAKMLLSSDLNGLVMKFSRFSSQTISIKEMYQIKKGPSGFDYVSAKPSHTQWCFHIFLLSGESIDFEALNGEDFKIIFLGMQHIHLHAYTQAAFYIDKQGMPRRACPSIIKFALESKEETAGPRLASVADRERYRTALKALKHEYSKWDHQLKAEKMKWNKENKHKYADEKKTVEVSEVKVEESEEEASHVENEASSANDESETEDDEDDEDESSSSSDDDDDDDDDDDGDDDKDDGDDYSSSDGSYYSSDDSSGDDSQSQVSQSVDESTNAPTQA